MNWLANSALSVEVLAGHRLRTALSLSGIVIGVASVIIMIAVGMGAERKVIERIEAMGTNLIVVTNDQTRKSGGTVRRIQAAKTLKQSDVSAIAVRCPSVSKAAGSIRRSIILRYKGNTVKTTLVGLEPDGFSICRLVPEAGRLYGAAEERSRRRVAVFAPTAAGNTFEGATGVGEAVRLGRQPFRAIGRTAPKGADFNGTDMDDRVFVPLATAMRRLVNVDYLDTIFAQAADGVPLHVAEEEIKTVLRQRHRLGNRADDFSVYNQLDLIRLHKETARSLTLLIVTVAALSWVVGGVGILAVMLMAVRERRSEIGLRRALGAKAGDVLWQFVFEAVILALAGAVSGFILGLVGIWITHATGWGPTLIPWPAAFLAVGASIFLGFACGVYPAIKASRLSPVVALKL
ncbi:multidrug ABC transporter substrate-binding protein [Desulfosarcina ovata subsp. sediminis]|uniref:Multidrug ABC transporter substrate-binding protein n=1 Tax=Desulfosarcina ovata subsp. sediminis TaxID=885957 RepID=A0A5K7ZMU4_9BACT|nr:ABC transporter permease [Desulfosarcina ovata]BBO82576.1 multidrug ABC transporter substrate-binding protein [Desulfosarcina ovata subsp. sediminis]